VMPSETVAQNVCCAVSLLKTLLKTDLKTLTLKHLLFGPITYGNFRHWQTVTTSSITYMQELVLLLPQVQVGTGAT